MTHLLPAFVGTPERNRVYNLSALDLLKALPDGSVDAFITDLPYGTTACSWDEIIPFEPMWREVKRTLKPRGVFVTTASQPFTSKLVMSNIENFKYSWVWIKNKVTGFANAKKQPMRRYEDIAVFYGSNYNPQDVRRVNLIRRNGVSAGGSSLRGSLTGNSGKGTLRTVGAQYIQEFTDYPDNVLPFPCEIDTEHGTQKPVALYEYLIRTYTQEGELVVDFCAGSGTTALAARNAKRNYIIGDSDAGYVAIAKDRLRTSILEPRNVSHDDDVTTMDVKDGYKHTLFATANATA